MNSQPDLLEQLVETHLAGQPVEVPEVLRAEFAQALAAHQALRELLDETLLADQTQAAPRLPPTVPSDYDIERELGRGGMGVVYLARQRSLHRHVALKVLRPGERTFGPLLQRFLDEARHLARLRHPNIVSIHEVGDAGGEPYFTMDFIDGEPLSAVIARGALTPTRAVGVLKQVGAAIQHAHRHGIIHRDLKPANVLLDRNGQVFVTDFGLARNVGGESSLTQSGELLGTPQYMAPEQARGQTALVGEATDVHALGLLLFEMLTGRPAFRAASPADILVRLLHEEAPSLRSLDRRIPRDLETICLKALQKSPASRYQNVSALLEDVRRFEAGEPLQARRTSWVTRAGRWTLRHGKLIAAILATAVLVMALARPLFDKSFQELVNWGDEELASGNAAVAGQVYQRALRRASPQERRLVAGRIVQTCRQLDDSKAAVDLALRVVDLVPEESFGRHDYLIAQALVARERGKSPSGSLDIWHDKPRQSLQLVKTRLDIALASGLDPQQQTEVEQTLSAINGILSQNQPWVRFEPEYLYKLPGGTMAELQAMADDETAPIWNRGRAAFALGKLQQKQGQADAALASYRKAYEFIRSVYPMYGGVKVASGGNLSRAGAPDAEECLLVRELIRAIQRLAPQLLPLPAGQIEFEVLGETLPVGLGIDAKIELCDPSVENPDGGLPHGLPRLVPLRKGVPVAVQVLDGTYHLKYRGYSARWDSSAERFARLLQVDTDEWPLEVVVDGNTVKLPPLRLRLAEEIELQAPEDGAIAKLSEMEFRWAAIPEAARYQVQLLYTTENPSPATYFFLTVSTTEPRLRWSELSESDKKQIRDNLIAGRTGGWSVDAYDAQERRVGASLTERRFLVAAPLGD